MPEVWTMGEILVEIMRTEVDIPLDQPATFKGPFPSGAPAIFIDTTARLGHSCAIIGGVGKDDFGTSIIKRLEQDGVCCTYINSIKNKSTAVAFVTYFRDGSRKFIFHIDKTPAVMPPKVHFEQIKNPLYFHVMGCSLMINHEFRQKIIHTMEEFIVRGAKVTFDPNIRTELLGGNAIGDIVSPILKRCTVLFPGEKELELLSGEDTIGAGMQKLFENNVLEIVVLKQGRRGCTVFSRQEQIIVPAFKVNEVDPTGAGDCFDAGFLCGLIEKKPLMECARMAAAAGALNAAAFGPMEGNISRITIEKMLGEQ